MKPKIFIAAPFNPQFNKYLPIPLKQDFIYQSEGLQKHIEKDILNVFRIYPFIFYC